MEKKNKKVLDNLKNLFKYFILIDSDFRIIYLSDTCKIDFEIADNSILDKNIKSKIQNNSNKDYMIFEKLEFYNKTVNLKVISPETFNLKAKNISYLIAFEDVTAKPIKNEEINNYFLNSLLELSKIKNQKLENLMQHTVEHITSFSESDCATIQISDELLSIKHKIYNSASLYLDKEVKDEFEKIFLQFDETETIISEHKINNNIYSYVYLPILFQERYKGFCGIVLSKNKFNEDLITKVLLYIKILVREFDFYRILSNLEKKEIQFSLLKKIYKIATWEKEINTEKYVFSKELVDLIGEKLENSKDGFDTFVETIYPEDRDGFINKFNMAISQKENMSIDHRIYFKDGSLQWIKQNLFIIDANDKQKLFVIMFVNTEQHNLFKKFLFEKEKNLELSKTIETNNLKISETSNVLKKSTNYCEKKIRTVLGLLDSDIDLRSLEVKGFFDKINLLISNLKFYINILDKEYEANPSDISIEHMFSEIAAILTPECSDNIQLVFEKDKKVPDLIHADYKLVKNIIETLTFNAIKNTSVGLVIVKANLKTIVEIDKLFEIEFTVQGTNLDYNSSFLSHASNFADSKTEKAERKLLHFIMEKIAVFSGGNLQLDYEMNKGYIYYYSNVFKKGLNNDKEDNVFSSNLQAVMIDASNKYLDIFSDYLQNFKIKLDVFANYQKAASVIKQLDDKEIGYDIIFFNAEDNKDDIQSFFDLFEGKLDIDSKVVISLNENLIAHSSYSNLIDININKPFTRLKLFQALSNSKKFQTLNNLNKTYEKIFEYKNVRILVVDDDEINLKLTAELLKSLNIEYDFARNGEEVIQLLGKLKEDYYDCILLDLQMPVLGGVETAQIIRNAFSWKKIIIIAMTARSDSKLFSDIIDSNINEVIHKPININSFHKLISKIIDEDKIIVKSQKIEDKNDLIDLEGFKILNIQDVLSRLANNEKLLLELLEEFYNQNLNFTKDFRDLLTLEKFDLAEEKIHNIKGTSGNLGLDLIYEASKNTEKVIKFEKNNILKVQESVDVLSEKVNISLEFIQNYIIENK